MTDKPPLILIVDDEPELIDLQKESFAHYGYQIVSASNGREALDILDTQAVDLLITDLQMPKMSGYDLIINARYKYIRWIPIFVISGFIDDQTLNKLASFGIIEFFSKPLKIDDLVERVQSKLSAIRETAEFYEDKIKQCFIHAAIQIAKFYMNEAPTVGTPITRNETQNFGFVTSNIQYTINEGVKGSMSLSCESHFINAFANALFGGEQVDMSDGTMADVANEMCNQILGTVKSQMVKLGFKFEMGVPVAVLGKNHQIFRRYHTPVVHIPFHSQESAFYLEYSFQK